MTITSPAAAKLVRVTPARCGSKAKTTSCSTAMSCISGSVIRYQGSGLRCGIWLLIPDSCSLIPDGAEMLVDAKHDEHEFGGDAGEDDTDEGAEQAGDQQNKPNERVECHDLQGGDRAGDPQQHENDDREPIEHFDHGGRHEPLPLEQVAEAEHVVSSRQDETAIPEFGRRLHSAIAAVNRATGRN